MKRAENDAYQTWLWGEALLLALLAATLTLSLGYPDLWEPYDLPQVRLVLDTVIMLAAAVVAVLAGTRVSVDGRWGDVLLCGGFGTAAAATLAFAVAPAFAEGDVVGRAEGWSAGGGRILASLMIALAPFIRGRSVAPRRAVWLLLVGAAVVLAGLWTACTIFEPALPAMTADAPGDQALMLTAALAVQALLSLAALVGFWRRYREEREDLDRWLALAATLAVFAEVHYVLTPLPTTTHVGQGDFLRLLSYGVLLAGVWRAIRSAEFGRAVAEERARVAREIHDGLQQYLFSIATHASMLRPGTVTEKSIAQLQRAAAAAQQEARFAVLALSSASGNAPFDAALRRYVEVLTADGELAVDLEIESDISLAPDEQIEVFRIVQEGLANVRKHANARRAAVRIGKRDGRRAVAVVDDGAGFAGDADGDAAGQGLQNIRRRTASIGGAFSLSSEPGRGTALEVVLRT
ncbi:MAG: sensor histidine kinase [Gaiellaceae bacterium]